MTQFRFLRPTSWLAKRLGLSVSTIERLRAQGSNDLPPCVRIGGAIRYDDVTVEEWLQNKMSSASHQSVG
ncbi:MULTISPECIES: helix-turn-helix transcriptional regulator [Diaphorobacter]|uniref:AlpA family transcriptional regulator n=1 Tax=Diaphorobacter nitroreducens TaxID=164759 RepID=A0AAX1WR04_9BURK|nr:AlpA family transcriptional regulator [Diaphorobacter nitroreducens]